MNTDKKRNLQTREMERIVLRRKGDCVFEGEALSNNLHTHSYEICYVIKGSGIQVHGDETIAVAQDDIFLAKPGVEHKVSAHNNGRLHVAYFIFDILPGRDELEPESTISQFLKKHNLVVKTQSGLRPMIEQILNYFQFRGPQSPWVETASRLFILDALNSLTEASGLFPSQHRVIDKAMSYIRSNLSWPPTLEHIAAAAGTSPRNLQLLFRKHLNQSVIEVLNTERCKLAAQYLDMGFKVNQTGPIIGIDDPAQFSRFYKRYMGVSPSERRGKGVS